MQLSGVDQGWFLLIHQLPREPAYLRVKVARHLTRIGAVQLKNTVYVLPRQADCYEDFQWLRRAIVSDAGEATICEARFLDGHTDNDVVALFHRLRDPEYAAVAEDARRAEAALETDADVADAFAQLARFWRRIEDIAKVDFFGAPMKKEAEKALESLDARANVTRQAHQARRERERYRGRTWVTREKMKVDRLSSAWLIRRFIDPKAQLKLVPAKGYEPGDGEVLFDMFEQTPGDDARFELFTHEGQLCTFEVLLQRLGFEDAALTVLAQIIHDIDVKDARYGRAENAGVEALVDAIVSAHDDDDARLARAFSAFDDFYALFTKRAASAASGDKK